MAKAQGISPAALQRIRKAHGLKPPIVDQVAVDDARWTRGREPRGADAVAELVVADREAGVPAMRLVQQDPRVRQREALALRTGEREHRGAEEAAWPITVVDTSHFTYRIVS